MAGPADSDAPLPPRDEKVDIPSLVHGTATTADGRPTGSAPGPLAPDEYDVALYYDPCFDRLFVLTNRRQADVLASFSGCEWFKDARLLASSSSTASTTTSASQAEALARAFLHHPEGVNAAYSAADHDKAKSYDKRTLESGVKGAAKLLELFEITNGVTPQNFGGSSYDLVLGPAAKRDLYQAFLDAGAMDDSPFWVGMGRHPCSGIYGELGEAVWNRDVDKQTGWATRVMRECVGEVSAGSVRKSEDA